MNKIIIDMPTPELSEAVKNEMLKNTETKEPRDPVKTKNFLPPISQDDIENVLGDLSFEMSNFNSDQKDNSVYWALSHSYDIITGLREAIKPEVVEWLRD
jgi:hypothetical protein